MQLRRETMDEHLRASGVLLSDKEQMARVLSRFDCVEIVMRNDERVGMLKVVPDGQTWHLQQIQVLPSFQGRGLGASLIRDVILGSQRAGASLELDVLKTNPVRRLYERLGFVVVGESEDEFALRYEADGLP